METSVDAGYVRALIDGDPAVERHFAAHFGRLLYIKLRHRMVRSEDIDDVRQETFARVFATLRGPGLRDDSCLGGFVNSVCDNVLLERGRRYKREPMAIGLPDDPPDARDNAETELVRGDLVREVRRVLDGLSPKDRTILRAVLGDGRDRDAVCAEHGVERDYLRVLLHRAKERFREHFESDRLGESVMNHDTALNSDAVERYVFGGMSDDEVAAFEAHLFDCGECSKELEVTASFAENARVVLGAGPAGDRPEPVPKPAWALWPFTWNLALPYAAAALFAGIAIYQGAVVVPEGRRASEPRVLNPSILRVVRGEPPVVTLDARAATFHLVVELAAPESFPRYGVEFRSATGVSTLRMEAAAPASGTLLVQLPADRFPDGDYDMVLEGRGAPSGKATEPIETYRFRVRR